MELPTVHQARVLLDREDQIPLLVGVAVPAELRERSGPGLTQADLIPAGVRMLFGEPAQLADVLQPLLDRRQCLLRFALLEFDAAQLAKRQDQARTNLGELSLLRQGPFR